MNNYCNTCGWFWFHNNEWPNFQLSSHDNWHCQIYVLCCMPNKHLPFNWMIWKQAYSVHSVQVNFLSNDYVIDIVSLLTTLLYQVQLIALSKHSNWSIKITIYLLWKRFLFCFKTWQKSAESLQFNSSISYSIWSGIKFRCYWVSLDYSKKSVPRSHSSAIICSIHIAISRPKRLYIIQ